MKKKTIILVCLATLLLCSVGVYAKDNLYGKLDSRYDKFKVNKGVEESNRIDKVKMKVKDAWEDIEEHKSINNEHYITITLSDLGDLNENPEKYLKSSSVDVNYILKVISSYRKELPIGSVLPLIYIKKDGTEVIVAYKEADGTNVYKKSEIIKNTETIKNKNDQKASDNWKQIKNKRTIKGKPILKID